MAKIDKSTMISSDFVMKLDANRQIPLTITSEKSLECQLCGTSFSQISRLIRHAFKVHEAKKAYNCGLCGNSFQGCS